MTLSVVGTDVIVTEPPPANVRSGADVVQLVTALAVLTGSYLISFLVRDDIRRMQDRLAAIANEIPSTTRTTMSGSAQIAVFVIPIAALIFLALQRRTQVFARILLAIVFTVPISLLHVAYFTQTASAALDGAAAHSSWIRNSGYPGMTYLATLAAVVTTIAPYMSRRWRRALWATIWIVAVLRILSSASAPHDLVAGGALGIAIGSLVSISLGAPDRAPGARSIASALTTAGIELVRLEFLQAGREGARNYLAETRDGTQLFVGLLSDDDRRRDLLFRMYRYLRVRSIADEQVFQSTRSMTEHRALASLWAREAGANVPRPKLIVAVGENAMCVVEQFVPGKGLGELDADSIDDEALKGVWRQLVILSDAKIAHRDLRASAIRFDSQLGAEPHLVGFMWAQLAANDALLISDRAQALVETALIVGVDRTVATAHDVLGAERLAETLPYLQLPALEDDTRKRARRQKSLVKDLRERVAHVIGVEEFHLEKLQRVSLAQVGMVVFIGFAVYLLLPMVTSLPEVWDAARGANWHWIVATLPVIAIGYVGSTLNFSGAVPSRLPFRQSYQVQIAAAFLNRVTPKNAGGMGVKLRYLTKRGIDTPTASASVGLTSVAGTLATTILMVVFSLAAGRGNDLDFSTPDFGTVAIVAAVVIVVLGAAIWLFTLTQVGQRLVIEKAWQAVRSALTNLGPLLRSPAKLIMLVGGSAFGTLCQILALSWTLRAFGQPLPFGQVGVVLLFANLIANASPTPGGVGVIEASLVFILTGFAVPEAAATSTVLVFRLLTFWLVIPPGWAMLQRLRSKEVV